jgi:hypothetical protein
MPWKSNACNIKIFVTFVDQTPFMRYTIIFLALVLGSCHMNLNKTVRGNGNVTTETRDVNDITRLKIEGGIDVELVQGSSSVKVEADENLQRHIVTKKEDGWLVIKTRKDVNLKSSHRIKVYVTADMITAIRIAGSGNVSAKGKFSGAEKLDIDIAGSGEVDIEVNTPKVIVGIAGSGNVTLTGETRDATVNLAGSGNYDAGGLLTENTNIDIAGSGDAIVHADVSLDANLIGSGNVSYRGNARIKSNSIGSGKMKHID